MRRSVRVLIGAAAAVALAGGVAAAVTGPTSAATPITTGAIFNDPTDTHHQHDIRNYLDSLIRNAANGSTIRISFYHLTDKAMATDLVSAAKDRGISVQIVLSGTYAPYHKVKGSDGTWHTVSNPDAAAAETYLYQQLGTRTSGKKSWVVNCDNGCIAAPVAGKKDPIDHNKLFLFSDTSGGKNVVVGGSTNLTATSATLMWNNAVTVVGNTALYDGLVSYFSDLAAQHKNNNYYRTISAGSVKAYLFPRSSGDTVDAALGNVSCSGGTSIHIAMWTFSRIAVARHLASLGAKGCKIQIAYTMLSTDVYAALHGKQNVALRRLCIPTSAGHEIVHSKYTLINGTYAGKRATLVFTGSHNFSTAALRYNDENLMKINSAAIYAQYQANFATVYAHGTTGTGGRVDVCS